MVNDNDAKLVEHLQLHRPRINSHRRTRKRKVGAPVPKVPEESGTSYKNATSLDDQIPKETKETQSWRKKLSNFTHFRHKHTSAVYKRNEEETVISIESSSTPISTSENSSVISPIATPNGNKWTQRYSSHLVKEFNAIEQKREEIHELRAQRVSSLQRNAAVDVRLSKVISKYIGEEELEIGLTSGGGNILLEMLQGKEAISDPKVFDFIGQGTMFAKYHIGDEKRNKLSEGLANTIALLTDIEELQCSNSNLDDYFIKVLVQHIKNNKLPSLRVLNFESNLLGDNSIYSFTEILDPKVAPNIEELKIENQKRAFSTQAESILEAAIENSKLCKLSYSIRDPTSRERINKWISRNINSRRHDRAELRKTQGKCVDLKLNDVQKKMASVLRNESKFFEVVGERLFLSLSTDEVTNFAAKLQNNTSLISLKVNSCNLGKSFAVALAESLTVNSTLEQIDLANNKIPGDAVADILMALTINTGVKELILTNQVASIKTVPTQSESQIANGLSTNTSLVKIAGINFKSHAMQSKIDKMLRRNQDAARKRRNLQRTQSATCIGPSGTVQKTENATMLFEEKPHISESDLNEPCNAVASCKHNPTSIRAKSVPPKPETSTRDSIEKAPMSKRTLVSMSGGLSERINRMKNNVEVMGDKVICFVQDYRFMAIRDSLKCELFKAIASDKIVEVLELQGVDLRDEHAMILSKSLETNAFLKIVNLNDNKFTGKGIKELLHGIQHNRSLKELHVLHQEGYLNSHDQAAVAKYVETNRSLTVLEIDIRNKESRNTVELTLVRNNRKVNPENNGLVLPTPKQTYLQRFQTKQAHF